MALQIVGGRHRDKAAVARSIFLMTAEVTNLEQQNHVEHVAADDVVPGVLDL